MIRRVTVEPGATSPSPPAPRTRGQAALVAAAVLAVAATVLLGVWWESTPGGGAEARLVVTDLTTERTVHARSVEVAERFELSHTHSVTGRRVVETFSVLDPETVALEELWFDEHGANLPTGAERIGGTTTTYLEVADGYRVLHHGRPIGSLPLLVGAPSVDHVLHFSDGEDLRLLDVARAGARIEVSLEGGR